MSRIRIGTRQSRLALWQTEWAVDRLKALEPAVQIEIVPMKTVGDRATDVPLDRIGDKGLFIKDLELALLEGRIDLAVHSLKDLPSILTPGLRLGALGPREDPRDALVGTAKLLDLPPGATIGTSSARRQAQILAIRPDLRVQPLRGNVETRLAKIARGECAAGILAAAGLLRLNRAEEITEYLGPDICLPAPGQGIIAVEMRDERAPLATLVERIDDPSSRTASRAERACTARLTGGCQIPVAAYAELAGDTLRLRAFVADPTGQTALGADRWGSPDAPEALGTTVAEELLERGAAPLLARSGAGQ